MLLKYPLLEWKIMKSLSRFCQTSEKPEYFNIKNVSNISWALKLNNMHTVKNHNLSEWLKYVHGFKCRLLKLKWVKCSLCVNCSLDNTDTPYPSGNEHLLRPCQPPVTPMDGWTATAAGREGPPDSHVGGRGERECLRLVTIDVNRMMNRWEVVESFINGIVDVLGVTETHMKGCRVEDCDAERKSALWEGIVKNDWVCLCICTR